MTIAPIDLHHILRQTQESIPEISAQEAHKQQHSGQALLIDVRSEQETQQGLPQAAIPCGRDYLEWRILEITQDPHTPLILMCAAGARSLLAAQQLRHLGFVQVSSMAGGYQDWLAQGLPIEKK